MEHCFYVETDRGLGFVEENKIKWLLAETFAPEDFVPESFFIFQSENVVEFGPRLNFATAYSTNAVGICQSCGLDSITRLERSRRYLLSPVVDKQEFIKANHDRMTECVYEKPLESFAVDIQPEPVFVVHLLEEGKSALEKINQNLGLGMDEWDIDFYYNLFAKTIGRNPTNVECFQLGQANSEHSRHWFFKGKIIIDGQEKSENLFDIIRSTLKANPDNSLIAFKDNSSAINGYIIQTILPTKPGLCSAFLFKNCKYNPLFTAETHNFPSGVAPFPGAETGTGGRLRDVHATGKGSLVVAGTAAYCTGNLNFSDYEVAGEDRGKFNYPGNLASPAQIMIQASNGASDYGNKFGEPVIQGFARTFGLVLPSEERREWIKPIMFTGGIGQIDDQHLQKAEPKKGMKIIQIGGPAYRIGVGGGSASSMLQGENKAELDFNAVQRGDAEMKQKVNRVIRTCVEMGENNPILSIHDQGAGGPCNVLTEIVEPVGGRVNLREIKVGDKTMSVLEIWSAEYQERDAMLVNQDRLNEFQAICQREKVNCEVLGEITEDGKITLHDSQDNSTPVDLELAKILGEMPQKTFSFERIKPLLNPVKLPQDLKVDEALKKVFSLPNVGSKGYLVRKVDRSVTGLIVQQQCCGPLQLPVSDVAVIAQSHFSQTGAAISTGEQPIKMLIDPEAGARLALGEALTNMVWAGISDIKHIKSSVNWMWAAKLPGEGANLYDAAVALRDLMIKLGVAADGGKDSLSMAAKVGEETVKSPGEMVVSAYATVPDIEKVVTPDLKRAGESRLLLINLAQNKNRLGGSALAQAFAQLGDTTPDVDEPELLLNSFLAVQKLIREDLILAGHDRSDGGLITALCEMAMAGNCGLNINLSERFGTMAQLFSEELGLVMEFLPEHEARIYEILREFDLPYFFLGVTKKERQIKIQRGNKIEFAVDLSTVLKWWEATSDRLEQEQMNKDLAKKQAETYDRSGPQYDLSFEPEVSVILSPDVEIGVEGSRGILEKTGSFDSVRPDSVGTHSAQDNEHFQRPRVAILREEGSNGDREMASAFYMAGFEPWDVNMMDLQQGKVSLEQFKGIVFVGGFSYADVMDSAKGWAGIIKFNPRLQEMFTEFYNRSDTFSLGICNGCQLLALLGWIPWPGIEGTKQPRFIRNSSERFESRWVNVKIKNSPAVMLKDMAGSSLGVWVAHGEGRFYCPDEEILTEIKAKNLVTVEYIDDRGETTVKYPFNPNGSVLGIAGLCSPDGRHLAMMPHPERAFLKWQWPYMPENWKKDLKAAPWLKMFQNARNFVSSF